MDDLTFEVGDSAEAMVRIGRSAPVPVVAGWIIRHIGGGHAYFDAERWSFQANEDGAVLTPNDEAMADGRMWTYGWGGYFDITAIGPDPENPDRMSVRAVVGPEVDDDVEPERPLVVPSALTRARRAGLRRQRDRA